MSRGDESLRDRLIDNLRKIGPAALIDLDDGEPQARVDGDEILLEAMLAGTLPPRVQRIWTNRRCIVATRAQSRLPGFARASAAGPPVAIRLSAGSAVVHHEGTLQISLIEALQSAAVEAGYLRLLGLLGAALEPLGIRTRPAAIAGAYCDGRFNLCVADHKIGGTAGFMRTRHGQSAGVFHACVTVSGNVRDDVALVSRFEQRLGLQGVYRSASHASVLAAASSNVPQAGAIL